MVWYQNITNRSASKFSGFLPLRIHSGYVPFFCYIDDMWKRKFHGRTSFGCSLNEYQKGNARKRTAKISSPIEVRQAKRAKPCKLIDKDTEACSAKLKINLASLEIKITSPHSCNKFFTKASTALNLCLSMHISKDLQHGVSVDDARRNAKSYIENTFFVRLVPQSMKTFSTHIYNLCKRITDSKRPFTLEETLVYLRSQPTISSAEIILITDSASSRSLGRRILVFVHALGLQILQKIKALNYALIFSLDSTHCVTHSTIIHNKLLSLLFRSPDSLQPVVLMQAYVEGEDQDSFRHALLFLKNILRPTFIDCANSIFLVDDSDAEIAAIRAVFGKDISIFLCLWHVLKTIRKHCSFGSASIQNIAEIKSNFSEEELKLFNRVSKYAAKAAKTISIDRHNTYVKKVSEQLAKLQDWWDSKTNIDDVRKWWSGYQRRAHL